VNLLNAIGAAPTMVKTSAAVAQKTKGKEQEKN
jgi:hypothetical protein